MVRKMQSSGGQHPTVTPHNGRKGEKIEIKRDLYKKARGANDGTQKRR
jgi:hypothetical protein